MSAGSDKRPSNRSAEHVGDMETLFWRVERDPLLRNTMVAVMVFDRLPDRGALLERIDRASRTAPGWRHRLVAPPLNLANPRWVVDHDFDLSHHVRWIGAPADGTFESVLDYARATAASGLDHDRPLWSFTVVGGLEGGKAAMIVKLHHVLVDGMGGIGLLPLLVDLAPEPRELGPMPPVPDGQRKGPASMVFDAIATTRERTHGLVARGAKTVVQAAPKLVREPGALVPAVQRNVKALTRLLTPPAEPLSPIMTERRGWSRFMPITADMRALAKAGKQHGASVNDAFIAAVGYGFARYHEEMDAPVEALRTTVAVSTRRASDPIGGNHLLGGHFVMPVNTEHPAHNVRAYHALMKKLRDDTRQPLAAAAAGLVTSLGPLISGFVGTMMKHSDLLMSNINGVDVPLWMGGAAIEEMYGFGPTMGTATNATMVSYNHVAHIGLNIDSSAVTDIELLGTCVREGFEKMTSSVS